MACSTASAALAEAGLPCNVWKEKAERWFITRSGPTAAEIGSPPPSPLPKTMMSGTKSSCSKACSRPVRAEPHLHLVADRQDAVAGAEARKPGEEPRRRYDQTAVRLDRLEKKRGDLPRRTGRGEQFLDMRQHRAAGRVAPERPVWIGIRHEHELRPPWRRPPAPNGPTPPSSRPCRRDTPPRRLGCAAVPWLR